MTPIIEQFARCPKAQAATVVFDLKPDSVDGAISDERPRIVGGVDIVRRAEDGSEATRQIVAKTQPPEWDERG
jgi:hypothetical protein